MLSKYREMPYKTRREKLEEKERYRKHLKKKGQIDKNGLVKFEQEQPKHKGKVWDVFTKGVYLLKFKGTIVYVGMSTTNCMGRINSHWNDNNKIFDSFSITPLLKLSDKQIARREKELIKQYKPVFNVVHNK